MGCAEVDRNGSTMLRLSSVLQHRAIRCGIPSMPAIASSAMPPTDALLGKHTLSTFTWHWTSTQHGGRGAIIKFGSEGQRPYGTKASREAPDGEGSHATWEKFNPAAAKKKKERRKEKNKERGERQCCVQEEESRGGQLGWKKIGEQERSRLEQGGRTSGGFR